MPVTINRWGEIRFNPFLSRGVCCLRLPTHAVLFAYAILSRLAYVLFVGWTLRREERERAYATRFGPADGFRRFRRRAAWVMNHDALAFILLCVLTRNTWALPISPAI